MTEIYTIALSSLGIALAQYCKGFADSTAYDGKRGDTHYHIGTPWDAWHVMSRLSVIICYVTALCAGAYMGNTWWLFACAGCNAIGGWIGFNLGDRWKGSMWMRYIGRLINGTD